MKMKRYIQDNPAVIYYIIGIICLAVSCAASIVIGYIIVFVRAL